MSNTVQNSQKNDPKPQAQTSQQRRPNERGVISVQGYFRIFDPASQKTIVEGRA
jgi:hypothetical protein